MAWYGRLPSTAELARDQRQKAEVVECEEAKQKAEKTRDPYRRKVAWDMGRRGH